MQHVEIFICPLWVTISLRKTDSTCVLSGETIIHRKCLKTLVHYSTVQVLQIQGFKMFNNILDCINCICHLFQFSFFEFCWVYTGENDYVLYIYIVYMFGHPPTQPMCSGAG